MCFSAPVSILTGLALEATGVAAKKKAKKNERLLVFVPILFGIQQLIEGVLWLVDKPSALANILAYGFLFFAFLLWPTYFPLTLLAIETNPRRRSVLRLFLAFGLLTTTYLFVTLITQPMAVSILQHSINYDVAVPLIGPAVLFYIFVVCGCFFVSSKPFFQHLGVLILFSAFVAWELYQVTFTSVWCFFAAIISGLIYFYLRNPRR